MMVLGQSMRGILALSGLALAATLAASPAAAATVFAGTNDGCSKTTCFNESGVFKQTWSASGLTGPTTIGQLLLARGVLGALDSSTFRLSFTLNGREVGAWGSYLMAGIGGDELSFSGEAFVWNPEDGDLTLVLEIVQPKPGSGLFVAARSQPDDGNPQPDIFDEGPANIGDIGNAAVSAAPEPGTWALMIGGFGLAGAALRRRHRVHAMQLGR